MDYQRSVVERTLRDLGIEDWEEAYDSSWANARCPLHHDVRPSFAVNLDSGGWLCRAGCGSSGDLAYLVEAVTGEPAATARRKLLRGLALDEEALSRALAEATTSDRVTVTRLETEYPYERGRVPRYFYRRGFTPETAREWGVGWDGDLRALVVPVVAPDGHVVGLVRRRLEGEPKYQNTAGLGKSDVLFGLDHVPPDADTVTVVEGPLDAMWLHQHGYPAVATLGANVSKAQADGLSRRFWRVVLAYDQDRAGRAAARRARGSLGRLDVRELTLPEGRKDVQECAAGELAAAFGALVVTGRSLHTEPDAGLT